MDTKEYDIVYILFIIFSQFLHRFFKFACYIIIIINIILLVSLGYIFRATSGLSLAGRIAVASIIVMIQGFFMGMPFPRGLKLLGESKRAKIVPVMWGVNGVTSVIGSALSVILSMGIGFSGALIGGAVIYAAVSFYKTL